MGGDVVLGQVYSEKFTENRDVLISVKLDLEKKLDPYLLVSYGSTNIYRSETVVNSGKLYFKPILLSLPQFINNLSVRIMDKNVISDDEITAVSNLNINCKKSVFQPNKRCKTNLE